MIRLRPPTRADARTAADLVIAADVAELGEPDFTLEDLLAEWAASDLDLATDAVIAEDAHGTPVGYAIFRGTKVATSTTDDEVYVALLDWAHDRARARGLAKHEEYAATDRRRALLERLGFTRTLSYLRLERELGDEPAPAVALRPLDPQADAAAVHAVNEAAFGTLAHYEPETLEHFAEAHLRAPGVDGDLSRVAEADGAVQGFALARRWADDAVYIDLLAVHPQAGRRGLGEALLRGVFAESARAGLRLAELGVASDNANALRLYERVGLRERWRVDAYERPLPD